MTGATWESLRQWSPFDLNALGLVLLLGSEKVNFWVGRLVHTGWLEYLPLLSAWVISDNRPVEESHGFHLYNITQGIHTEAVSPWLAKWMLSQNFHTTRSFVHWKVTAPKSRRAQTFLGIAVSVALHGFLVAMTVLAKDWYGFATALAMIASVAVRTYVVGQQRACVDGQVKHAEEMFSSRTGRPFLESQHDPSRYSKVLVLQPDMKAVTFWLPMELLIPPSALVAASIPAYKSPIRTLASYFGWLAFSVQIVCIGMADLATQIYTLVLLVVSTFLLTTKLGCDDFSWDNEFRVYKQWFSTPWSQKLDAAWQLVGPRWEDQYSRNEKGKADEFTKISECWIGSRLKAEVYEWPESYEFSIGPGGRWTTTAPVREQHRSRKRQDLYAWLALSPDEEQSMDKWDLFPHIRKGNLSWWEMYKQKKHAMISTSSMGPQPQGRRLGGRRAADYGQHDEDEPVTFQPVPVTRTNTADFVRPLDSPRGAQNPPTAAIPTAPPRVVPPSTGSSRNRPVAEESTGVPQYASRPVVPSSTANRRPDVVPGGVQPDQDDSPPEYTASAFPTLGAALGGINARAAANQRREAANPFAFNAVIFHLPKGQDTPERVPCRLQMDTGSTNNWISRRVIASTPLEYVIEPIEHPTAYRAFGGAPFFPIGQLTVKWYLENEPQSRSSLFLIGDEVPFDMVIGSTLIFEEGFLRDRQSELGIRAIDPTPEELAAMEQEAQNGLRNRAQLAAIQQARKARDAAARAARRQQQQSGLTSPTATSASSVTSGSARP